jgi:hypothetical protein
MAASRDLLLKQRELISAQVNTLLSAAGFVQRGLQGVAAKDRKDAIKNLVAGVLIFIGVAPVQVAALSESAAGNYQGLDAKVTALENDLADIDAALALIP